MLGLRDIFFSLSLSLRESFSASLPERIVFFAVSKIRSFVIIIVNAQGYTVKPVISPREKIKIKKIKNKYFTDIYYQMYTGNSIN